MASYKIELNSRPLQGTKAHKIMLRITVDRKHTRIALAYAVLPKHFIAKPQQEHQHIRQSNPKYKTINRHLDDKIQEAKDVVDQMNREGKLITSKSIKQRLVKPKSTSFIKFTEEIVQKLKKSGNIGNSKKYNVVLKKLRDFRNNEDLKFIEIDVQFLDEFKTYLHSLGNSQTTIHGNFRAIKALVYRAIDKGLIDQGQNPFFSFKLKTGNPSRVRLSVDEIKKIEDLELPEGDMMWHVYNAFLFSFYTAGMRVSDVLLLRWNNIQNGRLEYQMNKTGKVHSVKLIDKANNILSFYGPKDPEDYVFPFFSSNLDYSEALLLHNQISSKTAILNKYLKEISRKAGINKKISTHTARHSFADIARKKTDNIYNLSKTLGHSDLKITEAYLASFDEDAVDSTIDDVFN